MDYRTLGHSGCAVSAFGLGTMTFGVETDEPGAHEQLDHFVEAGGTLEAYDRRGTRRTWDVIDAVQKTADQRGVSMAEIALAWVSDRPAVTFDHPRRPHNRAAPDQPSRR